MRFYQPFLLNLSAKEYLAKMNYYPNTWRGAECNRIGCIGLRPALLTCTKSTRWELEIFRKGRKRMNKCSSQCREIFQNQVRQGRYIDFGWQQENREDFPCNHVEVLTRFQLLFHAMYFLVRRWTRALQGRIYLTASFRQRGSDIFFHGKSLVHTLQDAFLQVRPSQQTARERFLSRRKCCKSSTSDNLSFHNFLHTGTK